MLTKSLLVLKKWSLALLIAYTFAITIGSLIKTGGMPQLGSNYDDKIYHFIAYMIFTIVIYNYFSYRDYNYKIFYSALFVIIYGIIIEVLQNTVTDSRTLDPMDILANSLGVSVAIIALLVRRYFKLKMKV